jgi:hypothetical protein
MVARSMSCEVALFSAKLKKASGVSEVFILTQRRRDAEDFVFLCDSAPLRETAKTGVYRVVCRNSGTSKSVREGLRVDSGEVVTRDESGSPLARAITRIVWSGQRFWRFHFAEYDKLDAFPRQRLKQSEPGLASHSLHHGRQCANSIAQLEPTTRGFARWTSGEVPLRGRSHTRPSTRHALCPPKPKLFDRILSRCIDRAWCGM